MPTIWLRLKWILHSTSQLYHCRASGNIREESKERVRSAIQNSGYTFPDDRITVNLAPANIKKEGTGFDLPIAIGILAATRLIPAEAVSGCLLLGELSLDGRIKPVNGSLPMAIAAKQAGYPSIVVPYDNRLEAAVVQDLVVFPAKTLPQVIDFFRGYTPISPEISDVSRMFEGTDEYDSDYAEVMGQELAKRALEVAAGRGTT